MKNLQEVFDAYTVNAIEAKKINKMIKESMESKKRFNEIKTELERWSAEKKQLKAEVEEEYAKELEKLDSLKIEMSEQKTMMSDITLNELIKGNTPEVEDTRKNKYDPEFSVKFIKSNLK